MKSSLTTVSLATAVLVTASHAEPIVHDPGFKIELYATLSGSVDGMAYSPGGRFDQGMYATVMGENAIYRVTGKNSFSQFATGLPHDRFEPVIDPTGAFGGDMYVVATDNYWGEADSIMRVNNQGQITTFYESEDLHLDYLAPALAFAPSGSAFEGHLYVPDVEHKSLSKFDPSATYAEVGPILMSEHEAKDIEFASGSEWGDHAFLLDAAAHRIQRISSDGTNDTFYSWDSELMSDLRTFAFGQGDAFGDDIYAGNNSSEILRISSSAEPELFVSGLEAGKVFASEFGDQGLFIGTESGEIFRIYSVPEPAGIGLLAAGILLATRKWIRLER